MPDRIYPGWLLIMVAASLVCLLAGVLATIASIAVDARWLPDVALGFLAAGCIGVWASLEMANA